MACVQSEESSGKLLPAEKSVFSNTHSQIVLIKCLLKQSHAPDTSTSSLKLFNKWLDLQNQNQSNHCKIITQKDIAFILKEIEKYFDGYESADNDGKRILLDTVQSIVNNSVFQQYFRHHPETYCDIISPALTRIEDSPGVLNLLRLSNNFFKRTALNPDFLSHFLKVLFTPLVTTATRFSHDTDIFQESSHVLQRCLANKTPEPSTNSEEIEVKNEYLRVFEAISSFYINRQFDLAKNSYKLLFQSVCNLHNKNFKAIYNFFVFLVDNVGFNLGETFHIKHSLKLQKVRLSFSLDILADAVNILTNQDCSLDCAINKLNFSDFLKDLLLSVMNLAVFSNLQVYSIINSIISINPLIIEQSISNILAYLMINSHTSSEIQSNYENLMVSIFQVFSKLHRIEKLVSVLIRAVKCKLEANVNQETGSYEFMGKNDVTKNVVISLPEVENVLSNAVLQAFSNSIISLLSWQVINIFKTLNFHFAETLEAQNEDEQFYCYVEILSALFCCFLRSVRVAEHTVSLTVQEKFNKALEDLKLTLSKFGELLLNRKHNHVLMRAYLNICFTYGETCIVLAYYSSDFSNIAAKVEDLDYSLCNLVYLHNYLTREQWCIIAQRITNFGELKCKHIMHKLYLQKLKAMHTFKATCYAETKQSFIKDDALKAEGGWKTLLQEPFFLNRVLPEMDHESILSAAEFIFKTCASDANLAQNQSLMSCAVLVRGVLYCALRKISKLFKQTEKSNDTEKSIFVQEFFSKIDADFFVCGKEIPGANENFTQNLKLVWGKTTYKVNAGKLERCLNLIKQLPILHMPAAVQDVLLLFLVALLHDCKGVLQKHHAEENLELIVSGLICHNPSTLPKILQFNTIFSKILPLFHKWENIFTICYQWTIKNLDALQKLQDGIDYILNLNRNDFLKYAVAFLNVTNEQTKKARLCQESKKLLVQYRLQITEKIASVLDSKNLNGSLEGFGLALKFYLSQDKPKSLSKIEELLLPFVEYAISNLSNDSLLLLVTVLHNKSILKEVEDALPLKIWLAAKEKMVTDASDSKNHLQLYMLVFGHVDDEEFTVITNDLFEITKQALQSADVEKYLYYLEIWSCVLTCCFKPTKTKLWQGILDNLLKEQREFLSHNTNTSISVIEETGRFHQKIIQAVQVPLTATMIDTLLLTPSVLLINTNENFSSLFSLGISIMQSLLKQRNSLTLDRLPVFLQQYRHLLQQLCVHGNSDLKLTMDEIQILADCAHMLEKLTNMLIQNRKHVIRVAPYLIADFLNLFEQFSLPSNIRVHLNNCFYSLLSLCDQHAVSFLMRVLSTASTEMFKIMFEHYKKHYRFTGKV